MVRNKLSSQKKISFIIPAKNENFGLKVCIELLALYVDNLAEIIIVVESINDSSVAAVKNVKLSRNVQFSVILNRSTKGVTGSIQTGIIQAKGDYVFIYPADEINPIFELNNFAHKLDLGFDLVSATRYSKGGLRLGVGSFSGNILSKVVAQCVICITKGRLSDLSTGIKAFNKHRIQIPTKAFSKSGWSFPMEIELRALKAGKKIVEVPIMSVDRPFGGQSSYQPVSWMIGYLKVIIKVLLSNRALNN